MDLFDPQFTTEDQSAKELKSLFPFTDNIKKSLGIVYNHLDEFEKFKDSKILIVGAGPSTNEVKWYNLEYDYIFSLNHFYLNSDLKNRKVDIAVVGGEVDYQSDDFLNYVNEFNPILMFELHSKWEKEKTYLRLLYENYPKLSCFNTRVYGKLGGAPRLLMFALEMKPKELYFVGLDGGPGVSVKTKSMNKNDTTKTKKDSRIDTNYFDSYTSEQIITKACQQLGITTANRSIYNQSKELLNNMNDNDRLLVANELDDDE